jgi:uncharacterized protein (DUF305 family)
MRRAIPGLGTHVVPCAVAILAVLPIPRAAAQSPAAQEADVAFVQGMIQHHAQALVMTALVPDRTSSATLHLLAERITVSQRDEIALMRRWLAGRNVDIPDPPVTLGPSHGHGAMMPGMLTDDEVHHLADANGVDFERRFLQLMIRHHEGALTMVARLFGTPGAGQDSWIFQLASDVDADQRAEIRRMRALLDGMPGAGQR